MFHTYLYWGNHCHNLSETHWGFCVEQFQELLFSRMHSENKIISYSCRYSPLLLISSNSSKENKNAGYVSEYFTLDFQSKFGAEKLAVEVMDYRRFSFATTLKSFQSEKLGVLPGFCTGLVLGRCVDKSLIVTGLPEPSALPGSRWWLQFCRRQFLLQSVLGKDFSHVALAIVFGSNWFGKQDIII